MGLVKDFIAKYTACYRWSSYQNRTFRLGTERQTDAFMPKKASLTPKDLKPKTKRDH